VPSFLVKENRQRYPDCKEKGESEMPKQSEQDIIQSRWGTYLGALLFFQLGFALGVFLMLMLSTRH